MELLADQTAVVTGASSGIGRSISLTFAEHGADVVADVREEPREGDTPTHELIADRPEATATCVDCDVSSGDDLEATLDEAERFAGVDVLVNNAGIFRTEEFLEVTADQYEHLMSVNVEGAFFGTQLAAWRMIESGGGRIINVSSVAGVVDNGNYVTYCVSKGAIRLLTYAAAHRLGPDGIRVNAIHPGGIETAMLEDARMGPKRSTDSRRRSHRGGSATPKISREPRCFWRMNSRRT